MWYSLHIVFSGRFGTDETRTGDKQKSRDHRRGRGGRLCAAAASAVLPNVVQGVGGVIIAAVFLPMLQRVKKITHAK